MGRKRKRLMDGEQKAGTAEAPQHGHPAGAILADNRSDREMATRNSVFSMGMSVTKMLSVTSDSKAIDILDSGQSVAVIFYDFDGVLTAVKHRTFGDWSQEAVSSLRRQDLLGIFGEEARIEQLGSHLGTVLDSGIKIYCVSQETTSKTKAIMDKLSLPFHDGNIIASDHPMIAAEPPNHNRTQLFLLEWMKENAVSNGAVLYVSSNEEQTRFLADNGTCHTYLPGAAARDRVAKEGHFAALNQSGITKCDFDVIEQTFSER